MSANQITGLHTRLEASRKFLFGNMLVYGTANNSKIMCVAPPLPPPDPRRVS